MSEKIRHSGHFVDQKLKLAKPSRDGQSLFELLSKETCEKIGSLDIRAEGIRLSPAQDKLINAFLKLLHEKSENRDEESELFYAGNDKPGIVPYGGKGRQGVSALIRFFPTELYKAYLGTDDYSGADIKHINELLRETAEIKFLIIYKRKREKENAKGQKVSTYDIIEEFQSLYQVIRYFEDLSEEEAGKVGEGDQGIRKEKGEWVIALNPLLTDQIQSKYVEYPIDINRRTMIAAGGHNRVTESLLAFRDYMLRELSGKRFNPQMNKETLVRMLRLEKYASSNRKALIEKKIADAIQFGKKLGLIESFELGTGVKGQPLYIFHLCPEFK